MKEFIYLFIYFINLIINIFIFSYIYNYFFKKCIIEKKIIKNNKTKIVYKYKITLAFIYLALTYILKITFNIKIIFFILCIIIMGSLLLFDKLSPKLEETFENIDKNKILRFIWKIFYSFYTIISICTDPLNNLITNFFVNKFTIFKKIYDNLVLNNNDDDFSIGFLNQNNGSNISNYLLSSKESNHKKSKSKSKSKLKSDSKIKLELESNSNLVNEIIDELKSNEISQSSKAIIEQEELVEKLKNINEIFDSKNTSSEISEINFTEK